MISKNVKLTYGAYNKMTVGELRTFVETLSGVEYDEELDVSIDPEGAAFTIEGFLEGV